MTAAYSNAVVAAVLPHITDFAAKLDLPIERPVTLGQIARSGPSPYKDRITSSVWLTNGYWFVVGPEDFVQGFRAPTNWFFEQEFTEESVKQYLGQSRISTNDAIALARKTLARLGYSPEFTHANETPRLEGPVNITPGHIPYCRVVWDWPPEKVSQDRNITVEINLETREIVGLKLFFDLKNMPPHKMLKVDVIPELEKDYRKRVKAGKMFTNTNAPPKFPGR